MTLKGKPKALALGGFTGICVLMGYATLPLAWTEGV